MKKEFIIPSLEVKEFNKANIITLSNVESGTDTEKGSNIDDARKSTVNLNSVHVTETVL